MNLYRIFIFRIDEEALIASQMLGDSHLMVSFVTDICVTDSYSFSLGTNGIALSIKLSAHRRS